MTGIQSLIHCAFHAPGYFSLYIASSSILYGRWSAKLWLYIRSYHSLKVRRRQTYASEQTATKSRQPYSQYRMRPPPSQVAAPFSSGHVPCRGDISDTDTEWRISICQLYEGGVRVDTDEGGTYSGGLVSEFWNFTNFMSMSLTAESYSADTTTYGTAYLILNSTLGSQYNWSTSPWTTGGNTTGHSPVAYQERGEWLGLVYSKSNVVLSVSLCYAAFDFADMSVDISSNTNRTETSFDPVYDTNTSMYTFTALREAMGQNQTASLSDRRQLQLAGKSSWLTNPGENSAVNVSSTSLQPSTGTSFSSELYLRSLADMGVSSKLVFALGNIGNISAIIVPGATCPEAPLEDVDCVVPDIMHIWLIQEILRTGGSIAFALQTMITLLSSNIYYDQMGQFDKVTEANTTMYQVASVPVRAPRPRRRRRRAAGAHRHRRRRPGPVPAADVLVAPGRVLERPRAGRRRGRRRAPAVRDAAGRRPGRGADEEEGGRAREGAPGGGGGGGCLRPWLGGDGNPRVEVPRCLFVCRSCTLTGCTTCCERAP